MNIKSKLLGVKVALLLAVSGMLLTMTSCGNEGEIYPVSREEGSGTRSAFVELSGTVSDTGRDLITQHAEVTNSTAVMLQTVGDNAAAIGYLSLGSMAPNVKAIKVDGVEPTGENIKNGSYKIARTFNLVLGENLDSLAKDFIEFVTRNKGQEIVEQQGYVKTSDGKDYEMLDGADEKEGKITIAGSTSVAPVIEFIGAEYMKMYPNVKIEIQQSGSSAGIIAVSEGVCQIGMSSRELEEGEKSLGLKSLPIGLDGIVVAVNPENPVDQLSSKEIREIFSGQVDRWEQVIGRPVNR